MLEFLSPEYGFSFRFFSRLERGLSCVSGERCNPKHVDLVKLFKMIPLGCVKVDVCHKQVVFAEKCEECRESDQGLSSVRRKSLVV